MWIISNDHTKFVKVSGVLHITDSSKGYIVAHDSVELGAFKYKSDATDIIVKVAELIDSGARDNLVWEMPADTNGNTQHSLPMDVFK